MNIPLEVLKNFADRLPDANQFAGTCYRHEFVYQNHNFELKFFVVSDSEFSSKYWIYNPFHVQTVAKNGSHKVIA